MASQQPPRPWFRMATMMRPAALTPAPAPAPPPPTRPPAPTPAQQPTLLQRPPPLPVQSFRPPVAVPQPARPQEPTTSSPRPPPPAAASPPGTTPPSPVAPAPLRLPIASPSSATPTTPRSPAITGVPPPAVSSTRAPIANPAPPSPAIVKPESPIIKTSSSPGLQKAPEETLATRPAVVSSSSSLPPSPKPKVSAPSSPLPTAPTPKTLLSASARPPPSPMPNAGPITTASPVPPPPSPVPTVDPISTVRALPANPISSPKAVKPWEKTPPQSPIVKPLSHPPSPLTLPPAQLKAYNDHFEPIPPEAEQKTVLMHEKDEKPKMALKTSTGNLQNSPREIHKDYNVAQNGKGELKKDKGIYRENYDSSEEFGIRVVTLAGENKGAIMELRPASSKKFGFSGHKLGSNNDDGKGEGRFQMKEHENDKAMKMQSATDAFVNSNVQGVNNSILYNCAYKNRDPGVHLSVSRKRNGGIRGLHLHDSSHHD